jgi:hypothetical protein
LGVSSQQNREGVGGGLVFSGETLLSVGWEERVVVMPKGFEACRKQGGRIRTKQMSGGRYMHICFIGGKSYPGEVKTKKASTGSPVADAIQQKMR